MKLIDSFSTSDRFISSVSVSLPSTHSVHPQRPPGADSLDDKFVPAVCDEAGLGTRGRTRDAVHTRCPSASPYKPPA